MSAGLDVNRVCLREAQDLFYVLAGTMRAITYEEFFKMVEPDKPMMSVPKGPTREGAESNAEAIKSMLGGDFARADPELHKLLNQGH